MAKLKEQFLYRKMILNNLKIRNSQPKCGVKNVDVKEFCSIFNQRQRVP